MLDASKLTEEKRQERLAIVEGKQDGIKELYNHSNPVGEKGATLEEWCASIKKYPDNLMIFLPCEGKVPPQELQELLYHTPDSFEHFVGVTTTSELLDLLNRIGKDAQKKDPTLLGEDPVELGLARIPAMVRQIEAARGKYPAAPTGSHVEKLAERRAEAVGKEPSI